MKHRMIQRPDVRIPASAPTHQDRIPKTKASPKTSFHMNPADKASLKNAITKALAFSYSSRSCKDEIVTGNHYQSVMLGDEKLAGFRGSRAEFLDLLEFEGRKVLDIGSNLGEASRDVIKRGATFVHGVEYDALFVLLADLISLYNEVSPARYRFEQNDITKKFSFNESYDIVLAFSVFTYVERRLEEIANATREIFLVETHNAKEGWERAYIEPLRRYFPIILVLGDSDWGLAQQFSEGRRIVFACFKSERVCWQTINRIQRIRPNLSTRMDLDPFSSSIPGVAALHKAIASGDITRAAGLPREADAAESLGLAPPKSMGDSAYWLEFYRGYLDFRSRGSMVEDNPYFRLMRRMRAQASTFDQGAFTQMRTDEDMKARLEHRMRNFASIANGQPDEVPAVVLFQVDADSEPEEITLATSDKSVSVSGSRFDGYHRIGASILSARTKLIGYVLRVFGKL